MRSVSVGLTIEDVGRVESGLFLLDLPLRM